MKASRYRSIYTFLWALIMPYKWHYAIMISAPILASFYDVANNYALKLVVDAFSGGGPVSYSSLLWPITLFVSAQILLDVVWRIADIAEWRAEPYVRKNILSEVYNYIQHSHYPFFQNTPSGSITSRVKGILDGYDHFWASMHHEFTPKLVNSLVLTATLMFINTKVFLLVASWALVFMTVMYQLSKRLDQLSFINSTHRHEILGTIADSVTNIFTILSFSSRKYESKRLEKVIDNKFIPSNITFYKYDFLIKIVAAVLYWIVLISLFIYMVYLRSTNQVSSGDVVFVMGVSIKMCFELWALLQNLQKVMKDIGDFKSAFLIMSTPREIGVSLAGNPIEVRKPGIIFDHVSFSYSNDRPVLADLSLHIQPSEKVGLVGISGAGKSTIVSLLLRNFDVTSGQILIDGNNIAQYSTDSVREHIAVIPQDIMLFHRTIFDNIKYGKLTASRDEVISAARIANIHDFIESLPEGYDSMVGERGIKLSGGQRQRIAIARAILKNAPILILDEATSSLDVETERLIQMSLEQLLHNSNTTVIAIAHRLSTIKHLDRIIVLEKGQIVAQGPHNVLVKTSALYQRLWEMQQI